MVGVLNCKFVKESVVTRYHIIYELDSLKDNFQKYGKVYVTMDGKVSFTSCGFMVNTYSDDNN